MPRDGGSKELPKAGSRFKARLRVFLLILGPIMVALGGGYFYVTGGRIVSTDDAYIRYDKVQLSADVSGRLIEVRVNEHDRVRKGQTLFRIDPEPFQIALARAEAQLGAARAEIEAMRASLKEKQALLKSAQSGLDFAQRDLERNQRLASQNIVAEAKLEEARRNQDMARSQVAAATHDVAQVLANLGGNADLPVEANPRVRQAQAMVDQAALDLRHATIPAPADGIIAGLALRPGQFVQTGVAMCGLVESGSLFIEANLKETDLTYVKSGAGASITVDTFPGRVWRARVSSISPGTGSEFSLLPAENATGNWVKVVQRVPVRLMLEDARDAELLRAGMSVNVD
ncbi:MAG TPA: HlyD family secretion protein, partial [Stellaceae bacterium]|nr:HlyD family secretion protein [Stellaceae bacterium]